MARPKQRRSTGDPIVPSEKELTEQVSELGQRQDDGTVLLTEEQVEELGCIDPESMQANLNIAEVAAKKKAGLAWVSWGSQDFCHMYDQAIRVFPPSTMHVQVVRLTGSPITVYLRGEARSGRELYEALLQQVHRRSDEAEYKLTLKDKQNGLFKGTGRLIIPDTRDDPNVPDGPPLQQGARPAPAPAFMGYPGVAERAYQRGFPMPPAYDAPPSPPAASPATATHSDPVIAQLLAHMQSLTQHVVAMSAQPPRAAPAAPPPPPLPAVPQASAMVPQMPPPEGAAFFMPGVGWVQRATSPSPAAAQAPPNAIDQMRASLATVGEMVSTIEEAKRIVPGFGQAPKVPRVVEPAPDPFKTVEIGEFKIVQGAEDGSFRPIETAIANGQKIFDFISSETEKYQAMQRAAADRHARAAAAAASPAALPETAP